MDRDTALRLFKSLSRFLETGAGDVEQLQGFHPPRYRLRVGDWRIAFRKRGEDAIEVIHVRNRKGHTGEWRGWVAGSAREPALHGSGGRSAHPKITFSTTCRVHRSRSYEESGDADVEVSIVRRGRADTSPGRGEKWVHWVRFGFVFQRFRWLGRNVSRFA